MKVFKIDTLFVEITEVDSLEPPDNDYSFATWETAKAGLIKHLERSQRANAARLRTAHHLRRPGTPAPGHAQPPIVA